MDPFHVKNYVVVLPISTTSGGGEHLMQPPFPPSTIFNHLVSLQISQAEVRPPFTLPEQQEPHWRPFSRLERRGRCSPRPLSSGRACSLLVALLSEHPLPVVWVNSVPSFPRRLSDKYFMVRIYQNVSFLERGLDCVCCLNQSLIHHSCLIFICRVNDKWSVWHLTFEYSFYCLWILLKTILKYH